MAAQARAREQAQASFYEQLNAFELSNVSFTDEKLGGGAYGYVLVVKVNGVRRAAKVLHEGLVQEVNLDDIRRPRNRPRSFIESFKNECILLSEINHPNIVQFFGICHLKGATFPALVMELLMTSLHDYLEKKEVPLSTKTSILIDISQGLVYLHEKNIIHRDLTAANVLLTESLTAKIADLGMARILADQTADKMTTAPGNINYMPPEATEGDQYSATYGKPIDSFSMGHIVLFTVTQKWPKLLAPKYFNRVSKKYEARSEIERREESIQSMCVLLGDQHPIIQLAKQCLQDDPQTRPSSAEIMLQLQNQALKQQIVDLQKEKNSMSVELSHCKQTIEQLQHTNTELRSNSSDCRMFCSNLEQANAILSQKVRESQDTSHQLQEMSSQLNDLQSKHREMLEEKEILLEQLYRQEELLEEMELLPTSEQLPNLPTLDPPSHGTTLHTDEAWRRNMADFENTPHGFKPTAKPRQELGTDKALTSPFLPDSLSSETTSKPHTSPLSSLEQRERENSLQSNPDVFVSITKDQLETDNTVPSLGRESNTSEDYENVSIDQYDSTILKFSPTEEPLPSSLDSLPPFFRRRSQAMSEGCSKASSRLNKGTPSQNYSSDEPSSVTKPEFSEKVYLGSMQSNDESRKGTDTHIDSDNGTRTSAHSDNVTSHASILTTEEYSNSHTSLNQDITDTVLPPAAVHGLWTCEYCTNIMFEEGNVCDICGWIKPAGTLV